MRLGLASDIHLEGLRDQRAREKRIRDLFWDDIMLDVLVLAGDIQEVREDKWRFNMEIFKEYARDIVYVFGNHELYNTGKHFDRLARARTIEDSGIHVLGHFGDTERPFIWIGRHKFVGTTMWYPYNDRTKWSVETWSDNQCIKSHRRWWPATPETEVKMLWNHVEQDSIVVTHMLPSPLAADPMYAGHPDSIFYINPEGEDIIKHMKPKLWLHGHSHTALDIMIHDTRVIRNPIGYPMIDGRMIDPMNSIKVIDI